MLDRLKLSVSKDTVSSTNDFLQQLSSSKANAADLFSSYQHCLEQHGNPSLLFETFFHNLPHHKNTFFRMEAATRLYQEVVNYDLQVHRNRGNIDEFALVDFTLCSCPIASSG
jgi:hypothetical protein